MMGRPMDKDHFLVKNYNSWRIEQLATGNNKANKDVT
jgi:hypothetical protein